MSYEMGDIVRISGFRERSFFEIVSKHEYGDLYYVTNDEADSELLLPARTFTLVCRMEDRKDVG